MSAGNSAYSPLPQSNSDSDCSSEEELHVSQGNRIVNRAAKVQNSKIDRSHTDENNVVNYKPLDNDGEIEVTVNKFHSNSDEVSIVKPDGSLEIFSTSRKVCFVFSLLLCVFTTVAFLWILPCNVGSCPKASDLKKFNFSWEENLPNIEIYGPINLVGDHNGNQNLVFLTRSYLDSQKNYSERGLRCFKGIDGSTSWKIKFNDEITDADCKLFDINNDGFNDCLVFGNNILRAVNSFSGEKLWDIQEANQNNFKIYFKNFPLIIPDLNNDNVKELLLPCFYHIITDQLERITLQNSLIIISGKTGTILNKPLQFKFCSAIKNLVLETESKLSFTCLHSNKRESFQNISLTKVYKSLKNWPKEETYQLNNVMLKQHKKSSDTVYVDGFRLMLKNQGKCPEDCHVFVDVKDERESFSNKTIYSFNQKNTFGMTPLVLKSKKEIGFVIKYWKWHPKIQNPNPRDEFSTPRITPKNTTKNITKRSKKLNYLLDNSKILEDKILLESECEFQRHKRTVKFHGNKLKRNAITNSLHVISETISKITLNPSNLSVSNMTKTIQEDEIIQICKKHQICQPNVYRQKRSVMIAQLVSNENEKLITFNSKYIHEKEKAEQNPKSENWQLQSTIRVFNL